MKTKNKIFIGVGTFFGLFIVLVILVAIFPPEGSRRDIARKSRPSEGIIEKYVRDGIEGSKVMSLVTLGETKDDIGECSEDYIKQLYHNGAMRGIAMGHSEGVELYGLEASHKDYYRWAAKIAGEDAAKYKTLRDNTGNGALYDKYNRNYTKLESVVKLLEKASR